MKSKNILLKVIVELSRLILGATFVFSGFVKAVDPMGMAYKLQDYFLAFHVDFLSGLSLTFSIMLAVIEFLLGAFLIIGIYRRKVTIGILAVMCFMTPLTLYLAIANPVTDCGCFGEALIITNWETFYKNIILLACAIVVFLKFDLITNLYTGKFYWVVAIYSLLFITAFSIYNCIYEPVFDFRPYKIGANLPELMSVEEGKGDVYENVFVYQKDGNKKEFNESNYPWQDTTWTFVEMSTKLVKEGIKPVIHDFVIEKLTFDENKNQIVSEDDITQEVLSDTNYVFLMIAYSLTSINESYLSSFEDVNNYATDNGYKFYCLTASTSDETMIWEKENSFNFTYCKTDERTLKTITRSNPGLVLLKNGKVLNKWADLQVPAEASLTKPLTQLDAATVDKSPTVEKTNRNTLIFLIAVFVIPLLCIKAFDFLIYQKKRKKETEITE
ncbi:putative membrane protein YphA (DoxX/SURF4 family) [Dysgonomonas sp. PH5-45]|uniref:BT_3928 family protein n=1 Tax=unclassified Dysgonomonas TaxID=2630389 RepID=UPI002473A268|nr:MULTISPECIES: BT_3928 family protein [unclassified Dysgonomonas]MDH6355701.1 putative membrane protein YphA (DoxX/SURF4 family) [Dysgonomonas sp. PH5-45]MDH6388598.1 putative membrane protein YphA (DoxX/SURF4 family) [Dysgonomonas sp. PH5-37]